MNYIAFLILPPLGLLLGFFLAWFAVKLLFWPKNPILGVKSIISSKKDHITSKMLSMSSHMAPNSVKAASAIPFIGGMISKNIKRDMENKMKEMPVEELEKIIKDSFHKEFQYIQLAGAIGGYLIGLVGSIFLQFF